MDARAASAPAGHGARRLWMFGAQHPDVALGARRRYRSDAAWRRDFDDQLGHYGAGLQAVLRRWLDDDADAVGARLLQPIATAAQLVDARRLGGVARESDGALGLSMGEAAASVFSGVLAPQDAARLAASTGRIARHPTVLGSMAYVAAPASEVEPIARASEAFVAVSYSPSLTVIAGADETVDRALRAFAALGRSAGKLHLPHAYHSPLVAELERVFCDDVGTLAVAPATRSLYSCVLGERVDRPTGDHWWRIVADPCRFQDAVSAALRDGFREFVAVGGGDALTQAVAEIAADRGVAVRTLSHAQLCAAS